MPILYKYEVREFYYHMEFWEDGILNTMNKVILPRSVKRNVVSTVDLFLMKARGKVKAINLPAIMLEHMFKIITEKDGKHGMGYGYLLTSGVQALWDSSWKGNQWDNQIGYILDYTH